MAIDDQTIDNGCLEGVWPVNQCVEDPEATLVPADVDGDPYRGGRSGAISEEAEAEMEFQYMEATAGTVTLFNHWFPHRSGINRSESQRRTAYFIYNSAAEGDQHARHAANVLAKQEKWAAIRAQEAVDYEADLAAFASAMSGTAMGGGGGSVGGGGSSGAADSLQLSGPASGFFFDPEDMGVDV